MLKKILMRIQWVVFTLFVVGVAVIGANQSDTIEQILEQGVDGYQGVKDATLYEEGDLSNGAGQHLFAGLTNQGKLRRALLTFDLSGIQSGATVMAVQIALSISKVQFQRHNADVDLHRLTADWGQGEQDAPGEEGRGVAAAKGDATWTANFFTQSDWHLPGGDFKEAPSASARALGEGSTVIWEGEGLIADVQAWLDGEVENFGWIVVGEGQARRFFSSESDVETGKKPRLTVWYQLP